ncbi:MAG: AbrB/MazE/SpoVT family DNA-binding domain-containing protein [Candidatus Geothermincolales bacterium]
MKAKETDMKATGIVRRIDELGRIVIPMELRKTLNIKQKDQIEIFVQGDNIVLRKYQPGCVFCGNQDKLKRFKNLDVCTKCISDLKRKA